jgi:AraC family transcriptional regulator, regulatory protein of adaptative response / methylated-DNA-[protein]-cysteine methyltransferase
LFTSGCKRGFFSFIQQLKMDLTKERMYQACVEKDIDFEGQFFTVVKTTGIFCRPTCTARKPKFKNVEFFKTTAEAIEKGYRACKVCKPLEDLNHTPDVIKQILAELAGNPSLKFKDADLIQRGIEPSTMRRWFLKHHGQSFQVYQRQLRIFEALKKIQNGEPITTTAYNSGYESLSGFNESFKSIVGVSPKNSKKIDYNDINTEGT